MVASAHEPTATKGTNRLAEMVQMANGLNAARVFAAVFVVMLHSAIPYMVARIPVVWIVHDTSQHVSIDAMVFWVNGFAMPLFFLLAGLSVAKSSMKTPFWKFATHRIRRLGSIFLLAGLLIVPLLFLCWGIGLLLTERLTMANLVRLSFPDEFDAYIGPAHLWFLQYLLLLSIGWSFLARAAQRWSLTSRVIQGKWAHGLLGSVWGPLVFAVPTAVIFACDIGTPFRVISGFLPDVARVAHYAVFFVAGVWMASLPHSFSKLRAHALWHILLAAVAFAGLYPLTLTWLDGRLDASGQWAFIGLQAIFAWAMTFGFLGAMMRWCSKRRESIRYANEASFWLYLAHFPIVCALQLVIWPWQTDPWVKLLIVATTGVVVSIMAYEYGVRYSWLGTVINGARKKHAKAHGWRLEAGWTSAVAIGMALITAFLWMGSDSIAGRNLHTVVAGRIYRSNQLKPDELDEIIKRHNIRSVIGLDVDSPQEHWIQSQQQRSPEPDIPLTILAFSESIVPSSADLEQLQTALRDSPRPVLIIGGKRTPTLSGFGAAVAVLIDNGSMEEALGQLNLQYFQLDGAEHCIVAQPLREYRAWLHSNGTRHSSELFCQWTQHVQATQEELAAARQQQPAWQAMIGAPRYPRQF